MYRYLLHFVIGTCVIAGFIISINWRVDPYGIYRSAEALQSLGKGLWIANERVLKTVRLARTPADVVFLGTSRVDIGLGQEHEAFSGKKIVNLATFGQNIEESRRLIELSIGNTSPGNVILGLDFFAFNALSAFPVDYVEENFSEWRAINLLLSVSSLSASVQAFRIKQDNTDGECCDGNGFRYPANKEKLKGNYLKNFQTWERHFLYSDKWLVYPRCNFAFSDENGRDMLENFRNIIKLAHQHKADLSMFISPAHARIWETMAIAGVWPQWEQWKTELVHINEQEAMLVGVKPFPLWDFSGYDDISSEAVPDAGDKQTAMKWYEDSSHYTRNLGKIIVQRMFGNTNMGELNSWGTIITSKNLAQHLQSIRQARGNYEAGHSSDVADIEQTAREVEKIKQCANKITGTFDRSADKAIIGSN